MNINRTIIVTAQHAPFARALAAGLSSGGIGMFETPLYTGTNITHYVSSGQIDAAFGVVLVDSNALYTVCHATTPPVNVTLDQCQILVANSIVVDCDAESAQDTFARIGLAIQQQ